MGGGSPSLTASLRSRALLAHPALKFDKLLFVKRTPFKFNTYQDSKSNTEGGSLCVLSPVSADGTVTSLVPARFRAGRRTFTRRVAGPRNLIRCPLP